MADLIAKAPSHKTLEHVEQGVLTLADLIGNDAADECAGIVAGMSRVDPAHVARVREVDKLTEEVCAHLTKTMLSCIEAYKDNDNTGTRHPIKKKGVVTRSHATFVSGDRRICSHCWKSCSASSPFNVGQCTVVGTKFRRFCKQGPKPILPFSPLGGPSFASSSACMEPLHSPDFVAVHPSLDKGDQCRCFVPYCKCTSTDRCEATLCGRWACDTHGTQVLDNFGVVKGWACSVCINVLGEDISFDPFCPRVKASEPMAPAFVSPIDGADDRVLHPLVHIEVHRTQCMGYERGCLWCWRCGAYSTCKRTSHLSGHCLGEPATKTNLHARDRLLKGKTPSANLRDWPLPEDVGPPPGIVVTEPIDEASYRMGRTRPRRRRQ